jgi:hypothetical protein
MERESIDVGWFILRPFTADDIGRVYEVSRSRVGTRTHEQVERKLA